MDDSVIFNETNIAYKTWTNQYSLPFNVTSTTPKLQFITLNPLGGSRSLFIDLIAIEIAPPQASTSVYTGCYFDNYVRVLPVEKGNGHTVTTCAAACKSFKWFGVEYGGFCFCGDTFYPNETPPSTECNMACNSNKNQTCGGFWAISIYRINGVPVDLDFESYSAALQSNTGSGGKLFLGPNLAAQSPWRYTGRFFAGTLVLPAVSGNMYAILQWETSIKQQIYGLKIGSSYVVSWYVVVRPGFPGLDLGKI
jgi:hypothetical protein